MAGARRWPRFMVTVPVHVRGEHETDQHVAQTVNVSREGMFVEMDTPEPLGTRVRVHVELPHADWPVALEGLVVRQNPHDDGALDPGPRGVALFLLRTSTAWDRFCRALERP